MDMYPNNWKSRIKRKIHSDSFLLIDLITNKYLEKMMEGQEKGI